MANPTHTTTARLPERSTLALCQQTYHPPFSAPEPLHAALRATPLQIAELNAERVRMEHMFEHFSMRVERLSSVLVTTIRLWRQSFLTAIFHSLSLGCKGQRAKHRFLNLSTVIIDRWWGHHDTHYWFWRCAGCLWAATRAATVNSVGAGVLCSAALPPLPPTPSAFTRSRSRSTSRSAQRPSPRICAACVCAARRPSRST